MLRRGAATNTRDGCAPQSKTRGAASYELIPIEVEVFDLFFCRGSCASCDSLTLAGDTPAATTLRSAPVSGAGGVVSTARTSDEQRIREKKVRRRETQRPTRETCMRPIQCARYGGISRGRDHRSRLQLAVWTTPRCNGVTNQVRPRPHPCAFVAPSCDSRSK